MKVRGWWAYLYRAVDKHGNTIDFYLSPTRNTTAAKRFLGKALNGLEDWETPSVGFKTLKTAYATIKGFEVMRALRKGQASAFNITRDARGEARIVERAFGLGASALVEAVQFVSKRLAPEAA